MRGIVIAKLLGLALLGLYLVVGLTHPPATAAKEFGSPARASALVSGHQATASC